MARDLTVRLLGDEKDLKRAFDRSGKDADGFGKKLSGGAGGALGKIAKGAGLAGAVLGGGLVAGLGFATKAAIEAEKANARLDTALKGIGQDSPQVRKEIDGIVQSQSKMSGFDDEDLQDSFVNITRATRDSKKALDLLPQAMDLARAKGIDVAKAGEILAKVYNGQAGALKRYGIVVDPVTTQQDALKEKMALLRKEMQGADEPTKKLIQGRLDQMKADLAAARAADKMSTGQMALNEAQKVLGTSSEDYAKTTAGSMERASVAVENLGERVGAALAPAVAWLAETAVQLIDRFGPDIERVMNQVVSWITEHWPEIRATIEQVFNAIVDAWENYGRPIFEQLMDITTQVVDWIQTHWDDISMIIDGALQTIKGLIDVFIGIFTGDWGRAWDGIKGIVSGILTEIEGIIRTAWDLIKTAMTTLGAKAIEGIKAGLEALPGAVWELVSAGLLKIGELEIAAFNAAKGLGARVLGGIKGGIGDLGGMIGDKLGDLWQGIVNAGQAAFELAKGLGGRILGGIKDGIGDLGGWIVDQVRGAINWVFDQIAGRVNSALEFSFDTHIPGVGDVSIDPPNIAIPHLAAGGIVRARPGGTLIRAGEGGVDEAVTPLDGRHGLGTTIFQENHFHGTLADQPQAAAAAMSFALRGIA